VNAEPRRADSDDLEPVQRGRRFSMRVEFDRALADGMDIALHFEALDGTDGFDIAEHQRISLRTPEYRVHGTAVGEPGVYRLAGITLNHPALAPRAYGVVPDVRLTILDEPPSYPELVFAGRHNLRPGP
jgi:hypothetical protein